jgi:hypothetical protein
MQLTTNASCAEVPPETANTFRRNTFRCSFDGRRPATMTSTVSASPAPRTNRCTGPLPPRLRLAQINLSPDLGHFSVVDGGERRAEVVG